MFPLDSWAYCFHNINALESNQTADLLPQYHPLSRGTALAYPAWQNTESANFRSFFYEACISLLPQHEFLENAVSAQPFICPWYIYYSSPAIPPILFSLPLQSLRIRFPFPNSTTSTTESSYFSAALHHTPPLSTLTWKPYSYESLPWMPLDPALVFFISTPISHNTLFANAIWRFLLPKFQAASWKLAGLKAALYMQRYNIYSYILLCTVLRRSKDHLDGNFQQMCLASDICHGNLVLKFCKADENKILGWKKVRDLK